MIACTREPGMKGWSTRGLDGSSGILGGAPFEAIWINPWTLPRGMKATPVLSIQVVEPS